jgi:predicted phage terminase large subunit-like protein
MLAIERRLRERVRALAKPALAGPVRPPDSFYDWALRYLPHHFNLKSSLFHQWLAEELAELQEDRAQRLNIIAPRGAAKSTWASLAYPLYCAANGTEPYILLCSDTSRQAELFLEAIRNELENNELLRKDYSLAAGPGPVWRATRIRLRNGVTVEALGTGGRVRGRKAGQHRPTLVIGDDLQNLEHVFSEPERERSWAWLVQDLLNAGGPSTNFVVLGTTLHQMGIVNRLEQTPGWESYKFAAIHPWPDRMDLWAAWERFFGSGKPTREEEARAFYEANKTAMDAGARVLWPERESLYDLMLLRGTIGPAAFESEKQGNPRDPSRCEWPSSYFTESIWFDEWPPPERLILKVMSLDPSKGKDDDNRTSRREPDFSAFVMLGVTQDGRMWVDADMGNRRDITQITRDGLEHLQRWQPRAFAIETNAFQSLLIPEFVRLAKQMGITYMPIYAINHGPTDHKEVRIRTLGPYLAQGQFRFRRSSPGARLLVQQLQDFPTGGKVDGPDALQMAVKMLRHLLGQRVEGSQPHVFQA